MKFFSIFIVLFALNSCSVKENNTDFTTFCNKFEKMTFPCNYNGNLTFQNWEKSGLIDSNYVVQNELVKPYLNKTKPLKNISDYKCTTVGKFEMGNYVMLLYKMLTTEIGNGDPKLSLTTFSKQGKKIDEIPALWSDYDEPLKTQRIILNFSDSSNFEIKEIVTDKGFLNKERVTKKMAVKINRYSIQKAGKIVKLQEIANDVFKDNNPNILNEIPEK